MKPVIVNFQDLVLNKNLPENFIEKAFGKNSLGIILIKGIPNISKLRKQLLISGRRFIHLSDQTKEKYVNKKSFFSVGWSYGKEKMKNNIPDFAKGSYYANPLIDQPTEDIELIKKYPGSYTPNIWPNEIPDFEINFKNLGKLIYTVGLLVLNHCDKYLKSEIKLEKLVEESNTCKGRFLHYYPSSNPKEQNKEEDGSCGWHCDSGCLTGLISAIYFDENNQPIPKPSNTGLCIKDRNNNLVKINIPKDCVAYQIGEIIQILTGSSLIATPHCVKSTSRKNITRNTLAIFMDTNPMYSINIPKNSNKEILRVKNLPDGIPKLEDRFSDGMLYGEFLDKTYKAYYK